MKKLSTFFVRLGIFFFLCFLSSPIFAQVSVASACNTGTASLSNVGTINGKVAYSGAATIGGLPGTISIYWLGAPDNVWVIDFNGQPYYSNPAATSLPPSTSYGGWTALDAGTCALAGLVVSGDGVVPVEFLSLKAILNSYKHTVLIWETISEYNNKGFEVQRSSDGKNWTVLSFVSSSGTAKQTYTYTDESPLVGINYYRLNQIDYNGKSSLSPTVTVSNNRKAYFSISPNPTNSHFTISANGVQRESPLSISLYNVFGQLVSQKQTVQNQIDMDMSGYPVGTYIVEINYKNEIQRSKIVKQ